MATHNCSTCDRSIGENPVYCPHCLAIQIEPDPAWFPVTTEGSDNPRLQHELVPEHRVLPEERTKQLLREYKIERNRLPKINADDPAIEHLTCTPGDVIEIVRDSRTTDTARNYRLVVSNGNRARSSSTSTEEWRNPAAPAENLYTPADELTQSTALHILENLRAHVPPSKPKACEVIAVDREEEIELATERVQNSVPYTFIQGELGFGKSFFLYWVRDRVFPTTAVSFVDLDGTVTFENESEIVDAFRKNLKTPRSVANDQYANGLDELWDTFHRQLANLCAGYYEGEGYELREDRIEESLKRAVDHILRSYGVNSTLANQLSVATEGYFNASTKSLSQIIESKVDLDRSSHLISLIATLAQINGYNVLFGVDELEKSDRTEEHFEAIDTFIDRLPSNVSLFVTGTPELVTGGTEGNAMRETYEPLYDRTIDNRITLEEPTENDLRAFAERIQKVERKAIESQADREYSAGLSALDGINEAVKSFLSEQSPSFRAFLTFVEAADTDD